jgi:hypothetical protein
MVQITGLVQGFVAALGLIAQHFHPWRHLFSAPEVPSGNEALIPDLGGITVHLSRLSAWRLPQAALVGWSRVYHSRMIGVCPTGA